MADVLPAKAAFLAMQTAFPRARGCVSPTDIGVRSLTIICDPFAAFSESKSDVLGTKSIVKSVRSCELVIRCASTYADTFLRLSLSIPGCQAASTMRESYSSIRGLEYCV